MGKHTPGKRNGDRATVQEMARQQQALDLRISGYTYEEIGDLLGYQSRSGAWKAVKAVLDRRETSSTDQLRAIEGDRLDLVGRRLNAELAAVDVGANPAAVARVATALIKCSESMRRMHGIDRDLYRHRIEVEAAPVDFAATAAKLLAEIADADRTIAAHDAELLASAAARRR